jgi:hypothetical protein
LIIMPFVGSAVSRKAAGKPPWLALLERFYQRASLPPPSVRELRGREVPQPYRSLLVHSTDMTPTLERFCRQRMGLTVLSRELQESAYLREVVLKRANDDSPVEYGVIRICLDHLPPPAARRVLEEQAPFGNILQTEGLPHMSWPQAFFCVDSDAHMRTVLRLEQAEVLYGRRNVLLDGSRRLLAEVIEILAPVRERSPGINGHTQSKKSAGRNSKPETNSNGPF